MSSERFNFKPGVSFELKRLDEDIFKFIILIDNTDVGFCRFRKQKDESYYFEAMAIREEFRSKIEEGVVISEYSNLGVNLLEQINYFLKSKKAIGYLNNTIDDLNKYKLYENHGWVNSQSNLYTFDGR